MRKIDTIVLHHTACENPVPDIVSYHLRRGMREVFYHYLISMSGELHVGRSIKNVGSRRRPAAIEVAIVGRLHINNILPEQEKTLYRLIDDLQQVFGIKDIKGHKDFSATICPGNLDTDHYQQYLDNIRRWMAYARRKKEGKVLAETWRDRIILEGERRGIIDKKIHRADGIAEKWFVVALVLELLDRIEKLEGDVK